MGVDVECGTPLTPPPPPPKSTGGFPAKKATDSIWKLGSSNNLPTVFFLLLCSRLLVVREGENIIETKIVLISKNIGKIRTRDLKFQN